MCPTPGYRASAGAAQQLVGPETQPPSVHGSASRASHMFRWQLQVTGQKHLVVLQDPSRTFYDCSTQKRGYPAGLFTRKGAQRHTLNVPPMSWPLTPDSSDPTPGGRPPAAAPDQEGCWSQVSEQQLRARAPQGHSSPLAAGGAGGVTVRMGRGFPRSVLSRRRQPLLLLGGGSDPSSRWGYGGPHLLSPSGPSLFALTGPCHYIPAGPRHFIPSGPRRIIPLGTPSLRPHRTPYQPLQTGNWHSPSGGRVAHAQPARPGRRASWTCGTPLSFLECELQGTQKFFPERTETPLLEMSPQNLHPPQAPLLPSPQEGLRFPGHRHPIPAEE